MRITLSAGALLLVALAGCDRQPSAARVAGVAAPSLEAIPDRPAPQITIRPSFQCGKPVAEGEPILRLDAPLTELQTLICAEPELALLDRQTHEAYLVTRLRSGVDRARLSRAQAQWEANRETCLKAADPRHCVAEVSRTRLAELALQDPKLVAGTQVAFTCQGTGTPLTAAFYSRFDPPFAVLGFGRQQAIVFLQPTNAGLKYQRTGANIFVHQGRVKAEMYGRTLACVLPSSHWLEGATPAVAAAEAQAPATAATEALPAPAPAPAPVAPPVSAPVQQATATEPLKPVGLPQTRPAVAAVPAPSPALAAGKPQVAMPTAHIDRPPVKPTPPAVPRVSSATAPSLPARAPTTVAVAPPAATPARTLVPPTPTPVPSAPISSPAVGQTPALATIVQPATRKITPRAPTPTPPAAVSLPSPSAELPVLATAAPRTATAKPVLPPAPKAPPAVPVARAPDVPTNAPAAPAQAASASAPAAPPVSHRAAVNAAATEATAALIRQTLSGASSSTATASLPPPPRPRPLSAPPPMRAWLPATRNTMTAAEATDALVQQVLMEVRTGSVRATPPAQAPVAVQPGPPSVSSPAIAPDKLPPSRSPANAKP
ncbi:MAG: hypothetical protein ABWX87_13145 [Pseudoxanthomonas sp.]